LAILVVVTLVVRGVTDEAALDGSDTGVRSISVGPRPLVSRDAAAVDSSLETRYDEEEDDDDMCRVAVHTPNVPSGSVQPFYLHKTTRNDATPANKRVKTDEVLAKCERRSDKTGSSAGVTESRIGTNKGISHSGTTRQRKK
jgi:hypothetical protein